MKSMAVFDAPPVPGCWQGGEVIRIVDPLGLQVVWISPALAGGIVGYFTRTSSRNAWTEVLACSAEMGRAGGSELLLRDRSTQEMVPAWGSDATWTFASRDPTQTTVAGRIGDHAFKISLQCADGELQILVESGDKPPSFPDAGLRLHVGAVAGSLHTPSLTDGILQFKGGSLASIAYQHSPELTCHVREGDGTTDTRIDFVPNPRAHPDTAALPMMITLLPTPTPLPANA